MVLSDMNEIARGWALLCAEVGFALDFDGAASPQAFRSVELLQERIREHILETKDKRLFSLLHLLGLASLRMEQELWPEEFARLSQEVTSALASANNSKTSTS